METLTLASYAKINLTLEVSARRPDGYHDIDSVVQLIDIADELVTSKADAGTIEVAADVSDVPSGRENLVYRAAEAFFDVAGVAGGAKFRLRKRIPAQAGLGGGSGNAAAAIAALNRLYDCGFDADELAAIAARVGSDAALFIYGGTVRMRGRGERVETLADAPALELIVVKPGVGVSTAWAYAELDRRGARELSGASDRAERAVAAGDRESLISALQNDFDPVVTGAFEEISRAKRLLGERGARSALLSGSGSAVFGIFDSRADAEVALQSLSREFEQAFLTRTLGRCESSLIGKANE